MDDDGCLHGLLMLEHVIMWWTRGWNIAQGTAINTENSMRYFRVQMKHCVSKNLDSVDYV